MFSILFVSCLLIENRTYIQKLFCGLHKKQQQRTQRFSSIHRISKIKNKNKKTIQEATELNTHTLTFFGEHDRITNEIEKKAQNSSRACDVVCGWHLEYFVVCV